MIIHLIKTANELGWKLICSIDVSAKKMERNDGIECPNDVHSLYFCKVSDDELDTAFSPKCDDTVTVLPPGPFMVPECLPEAAATPVTPSDFESTIAPPMGWCLPPPPPDYEDEN